MKTLILVLLTFVFLISVLLDKARRTISVKELRRRARNNSGNTSSIYKLVAQGEVLKMFLWLVGGISGAILFLEIASISKAFATIIFLLVVWVVLSDKPLSTDGWLWKIAGTISLPTYKLIVFMYPVLIRFSKFVSNLRPAGLHTGLYDKEDLLELISNQDRQIDNRIAKEDLQIVAGALTFGDKLVREIMTPWSNTKIVAATDTVGPLLMDELHASGHTRFPVVAAPTEETSPNIVGTLYLRDLLSFDGRGKVRNIMIKEVFYINEAQSLRQALNVCLKTHHQLLVVVNNFEEISGLISLEDIVGQILGQKIVDEFDQYDDLKVVAGIEVYKSKKSSTHGTV